MRVVLVGLLLLALAREAAGQIALPEGFISELVYQTPLPFPTAIAFAPDGRMFIAFKSGHVILHREGHDPRLFLDLTAEVNTWGDRGLLGIAAHPEFPEQPYVYLLYTYDPPGLPGLAAPDDLPDGRGARVSRLLRIEADPAAEWDLPLEGGREILAGKASTLENIGDPASSFGPASCDEGGTPSELGSAVRDCIPADGPSHAIGTVAFGPDGALYMGSGDGGRWTDVDPRALRTLDIDSLAGKILRIDPLTGEGLADNPFWDGDPSSNRSRVWNLGLRNPFRFAFHPVTGEPHIGDVGWELWEELDAGRGANFGWPCFEGDDNGSAPQPAFQANPLTASVCAELDPEAVTAPLFSYSRDGRGTAMIVGDFYTGPAYPEEYDGALFYADFDRQFIRTLRLGDDGSVASAEDFASSTGPIVQIARGPDTNLYYVLATEDRIMRIRYVGDGNHPPIAVLRVEPSEGDVPLTVSFRGSDSSDPDGDALEYEWDFGDGGGSSEADPVHTYEVAAVRTVTLVVRDAGGEEGHATIRIFAGNTAPEPEIVAPAGGTTYAIGETIPLIGRATDEKDGEVPDARLRWSALLHHADHVHPDFFTATGSAATLVPEDHGDGTWLELSLEATDSDGAIAAVTRELRPREVELSFDSVPEGLEIVYEGSSHATPFTVRTIAGSERQVIAAAVQQHRSFMGWSDGSGERVREIPIGETDAVYSALYENLPPRATIRVLSIGTGPLAVVLSAETSSDPEGNGLTFEWDTGEGAPIESGPTFTRTWNDRATARVRLTVRDALGAEDQEWIDLPVRRRAAGR